MTIAIDLAAAIAPRIKASYSPNLHKFVAAWLRRRGTPPEVWRDRDGALWIGDQEQADQDKTYGFTGLRMHRVLVDGTRANKDRGWFTNLGPGNMTHESDFWDRYRQIGRCAIDTEHRELYIDGEGRYTMDGDTRTCTWCGAQHHRRVEIKTITKEIEYFDPIAKGAGA